jgi:hypothetical protein
MAIFWVVAPCTGRNLPMLQRAIALMMEATSTSEKSVNFYQTAWRNMPEDSRLYTVELL